MIECPHCSSPLEVAPEAKPEDPIACEVCGYRSDQVAEYFWLYLGGGAILLVGLVLGLAGVLSQDNHPDDWNEALLGWFPLGPWPRGLHWLALLVTGIVLSLVGMGFTRHFRSAYWCGLAWTLHELFWTGRKLLFDRPPPSAPATSAALLIAECLLLVLILRLGRALRRTPHRDVNRLQKGVSEAISSATSRKRP